jgi:hypothetical protein
MLMGTGLATCRLSQGIVLNATKKPYMTDRPPCYLAFMLRLWCTTSEDGVVWRASLEDARTGELQGFADLRSLWAFLEAQAANRARDANDDNT